MEPERTSAPSLRLIEGGAQNSPPTSFDAAYRRYCSYVAAIAHQLLGRDGEVDDVVQDVFLQAYRGFEQLERPEALKRWLATITVRVVSQRLRRRRVRRILRLEPDYDYDQLPSADASPETRLWLARVYGALDDLPVQERVAWLLRHVEGATLEEVAGRCECSLATAKRRISAAHARLQRVVVHG